MNILHKRQGQMDLYIPYFYTETICDFKHLLADDELKLIIIKSLQYLVKQQLVEIYAFVIMPHHIHLLWSIQKPNGKESANASFTKFTAHEFRKYLLKTNPIKLESYRSAKMDRTYQFWKRDPLVIPLSTETILMQKLDYIHFNPAVEKWQLCRFPEDSVYRSVSHRPKQFGFI